MRELGLLFSFFLILGTTGCRNDVSPKPPAPVPPLSCSGSQHIENNSCVENSRQCSPLPANALSGIQNWDGASWSSCLITSCLTNYSIFENVCKYDFTPNWEPIATSQLTPPESLQGSGDLISGFQSLLIDDGALWGISNSLGENTIYNSSFSQSSVIVGDWGSSALPNLDQIVSGFTLLPSSGTYFFITHEMRALSEEQYVLWEFNPNTFTYTKVGPGKKVLGPGYSCGDKICYRVDVGGLSHFTTFDGTTWTELSPNGLDSYNIDIPASDQNIVLSNNTYVWMNTIYFLNENQQPDSSTVLYSCDGNTISNLFESTAAGLFPSLKTKLVSTGQFALSFFEDPIGNTKIVATDGIPLNIPIDVGFVSNVNVFDVNNVSGSIKNQFIFNDTLVFAGLFSESTGAGLYSYLPSTGLAPIKTFGPETLLSDVNDVVSDDGYIFTVINKLRNGKNYLEFWAAGNDEVVKIGEMTGSEDAIFQNGLAYQKGHLLFLAKVGSGNPVLYKMEVNSGLITKIADNVSAITKSKMGNILVKTISSSGFSLKIIRI